jgi:hypothetical protein
MPVPWPLSRGVVLWPDVAAPELSLLRGIWLCAEAIPLETSNAAAANMAEYFLMSSFFSFAVGSRRQRRATASVPRVVFTRAKFPAGTQAAGCDRAALTISAKPYPQP